ncbi:MAG: hypothetical protein STSR0008_03100 [Ignavibacterium sp.]
MTKKQLLEMIEKGENTNCEFKLKFSSSEKIAKEMIAFANTKGGYIIFGVDDSKKIIGVESEKSEAELIKDVAENYCVPPINFNFYFMAIERKELVIVEVLESKNKPHKLQDYKNYFDINKAEVYLRTNNKSVQASKEMIKLMQADTNKMSLKNYRIGNIEKSVFDFLNTNEFITVNDLCKIANISQRRASRTLIKMVRAKLLFIHTKDNGTDYFTL